MFGIDVGSSAWYLLMLLGGLAVGVGIAAFNRWRRGR